MLLIKDILGISAEDYSEIRHKAAEQGMSHFQMWRSLFKMTPDFFAHSGYLVEYVSLLNSHSWWKFDIAPIIVFIQKYIDESSVETTVSNYLDWLATIDIQDEVKEDYEGLTLMTIHAAKGLEWGTVIIAGCNEEILPSKQAIRNDEIEAERRLFYVAMTRAKDNLILTVRPTVTETNGREYVNPESRFIGEAV
jgi:DNA helicase-2/ATP-dependent DNA helicase PcrA